MPRIQPLRYDDADPKTRATLDGVRKAMGGVPNLIATLARGPAALDAYLALSKAVAASTIPAPVREQIALPVAGANRCEYCAAAHTVLGRHAGVDEAELERGLRAESENPKTQAALAFARAVVTDHGMVDDGELQALRAAGHTDGEALEIVATVVLNILTNYVNHVADTEVDFPSVELPVHAGA